MRRADGAIPPRPSRRAIPTRSATSRLCLAGSSSPHRGIRPCAAHAELPPRHTATPALRFSVTGHCRVRRGPHGRMQAKVWTNDTVAATLAGHEAAVWSVAVTPDSLVLTGSADRTIKMWQSNGYEPGLAHSVVTDAEWRSRPGEPYAACRLCVRTFPGHTDCVRALVIVPELGFASAGNDCTVRMWAYSGECLAVLNGHEGFVYALVRWLMYCGHNSMRRRRSVIAAHCAPAALRDSDVCAGAYGRRRAHLRGGGPHGQGAPNPKRRPARPCLPFEPICRRESRRI